MAIMRQNNAPVRLMMRIFLSLILLTAVLLAAVSVGPAPVTISEISRMLLAGPTWTGNEVNYRIIWDLRLPRVLLAATSGAGLALVGCVLQSLTRNPLADPWLLGISSGASVGAVVVTVLGLSAGMISLPLGAFCGALCAFLLVLLLAGRSLAGESAFFILAGVGVTQLFSALTSLITLWWADANTTRGVMFWLLGSFSDARWSAVALCSLVLLAVLILCWCRAEPLDIQAFGSDSAIALGVTLVPLRLQLYVATMALTAVIVAFSGAVGFIGLIVPHVTRLMTGYRHRQLLPLCALIGALFSVVADTLARTLFAPRELPVGVLTSLLGVPVFITILYRKMHR